MSQGIFSRIPSIANPLSLRIVLILKVVLPLALVCVAGSVSVIRSLEESLERRLQEDVELVGRAIQPALSRALEQGRMGTVNQALEAAFSIDRVFGAYVYDSKGRTVATGGREGTLPPRRQVSRLAQEGDQKGEYGEVAGREVYSYFIPLTDSGARIIGLLHVTRRLSDFDGDIGEIRRQAMAFGLVAFVLVVCLVLIGHHGAVGKHLGRIIMTMRCIEAGDRTHRSPETGPTEIAQLARTLNSMLDSIERAENEIEQHRIAEHSLQSRLRGSRKLAAIGQLAAGVAHELGSPLSVIYGKAQRLLRKDLPDEIRNALEQSTREVRRMEKIVRHLLDFGRGYEIRFRSLGADRVARSASSSLQAQSEVSLSIEIKGSDPPPAVYVDPSRLEQALVNLLKNAIQASPKGRVRLSWFSEEPIVGFAIEDDGPGIDDSVRHHLFEPFFTTKKPGEGTGLGLALAYRIVEEHEGRIEVGESEMGGACFRICLPAPPEPGKDKGVLPRDVDVHA